MEPDELERIIFFERAKDEAEQAVKRDPHDSSALTRWGGALLELAHFRQGHDAYDMIELARPHPSTGLQSIGTVQSTPLSPCAPTTPHIDQSFCKSLYCVYHAP